MEVNESAANNGQTADRDEKGRFGPGNSFAYPPGTSGNLSGRPKKQPITEILEEIFSEDRQAIKDALRGVFTGKSGMAKVMLTRDSADRLEGKVTQPVHVDGELNLTLSERFARAKQFKDDVLSERS